MQYRYKRSLKAILSAVGLVFISQTAYAQSAPEVSSARKKMIALGWDSPDTSQLRANLAEMEITPFDGTSIAVAGVDEAGRKVAISWAFSATPWKREWFAKSVDDLKAIQPARLTDNFIRVGVNPGGVDWFDDEGWKHIVEHFRIVSWIAKEGKLKGILFDPESYTSNAPFYYASQPQAAKYSFEEYQAKARQRGREVVEAIASVDPNLVVLTLFMNSVNADGAASTDPFKVLQLSKYNLYPAFINGWLDSAPATMKFVDGAENQAYNANSELDFLRISNLVRNTALSLVAPENRQKYLAQVQTSFGLYLDAYLNPPTDIWYVDSKGAAPAQRFQINATTAARVADEYVWVYGEKNRWWSTENKNVSPKSWDDVMPGISDGILAATRPAEITTRKLAELQRSEKLVNLLQNGNFSAGQANVPQVNGAADWQAAGAPAHWSYWQATGSKGTFSQDNGTNSGNDQSGAARAAGVQNGCFTQRFDVKPGEMYAVLGKLKQVGQGVSWLRVRWQTPDNKFIDPISDVWLHSVGDPQSWQKIEDLVTVPDGAGKMVILLVAGNQPTAQDVVWFDDVAVYKLP
jgi:hypothetical protein